MVCPVAPPGAEAYADKITGYVLWGVIILFGVGVIIGIGAIVAGRVFAMPHASKTGVVSVVVVFIAAVAYMVLPGMLDGITGSGLRLMPAADEPAGGPPPAARRRGRRSSRSLVAAGRLSYAVVDALTSRATRPPRQLERAPWTPRDRAAATRSPPRRCSGLPAGRPQPAPRRTPAADHRHPGRDHAGPAGVPTGFPHTPEGAVGQLAAIATTVLQAMSIERPRPCTARGPPGAPPVDDWELTAAVQAFLGSAAGQYIDRARHLGRRHSRSPRRSRAPTGRTGSWRASCWTSGRPS